MKLSKSVAVIVVIGVCLILLPKPGRAEQKIGVGGKLVRNIPFLIGSLDFNQFGVEVGVGMKSSSNEYSDASLLYYLANAKYLFPLSRQLQPYIGGGILGVNASVSTSTNTTDTPMSVGFNGFDIFGGLQAPLDSYGLPLTVFGGVNYLRFGIIGAPTFHLGVKFTF